MMRIKAMFFGEDNKLNELNEFGINLNEYLPKEIITYILSYVDEKSIFNCKLVCKNWNEIIRSYYFWNIKCKRANRKAKHHLPWYVHYCLLYKDFFDVNLILNGNGQNKFNNWIITKTGGDKWRTENVPEGADSLPDSPDFEGHESCFVTSYGDCEKFQLISLQCKLYKEILDKFQPKIVLSEWYAGRFDCGSRYQLSGFLLNSKGEVIARKDEKRFVQQWLGKEWSKVEIVFDNYLPDVTKIKFVHYGCDTQFWAGHFGSKMAGATIRILYDSL